MEENYKIVDFQKYCATCKHKDVEETEDPCNECLTEPARPYSQKPVNWEEKR